MPVRASLGHAEGVFSTPPEYDRDLVNSGQPLSAYHISVSVGRHVAMQSSWPICDTERCRACGHGMRS